MLFKGEESTFVLRHFLMNYLSRIFPRQIFLGLPFYLMSSEIIISRFPYAFYEILNQKNTVEILFLIALIQEI
jgi:hypothetical protein